MNKIRRIIKEELKKIQNKNSNFQDNYGLPESFNLYNHAKELESKVEVEKSKLLKVLEIISNEEILENEKLNNIKSIVSDHIQ